MKVFRYMWTASSLDKKRTTLYSELKSGRVTDSAWFLTLSGDGANVMEIYASKAFKNDHIRESDAWIIGAASTKEEAQELAGSIVSLCVAKTGKADVYAYLKPYLTETEDSDA